MQDVETLKEQKRDAEASYRNSMPSSLLQQQRLRVCEVCSSYLENFEGLHDNDKRLADHFGGKLHIGFIDLRFVFFLTEKKTDLLLDFSNHNKSPKYVKKTVRAQVT